MDKDKSGEIDCAVSQPASSAQAASEEGGGERPAQSEFDQFLEILAIPPLRSQQKDLASDLRANTEARAAKERKVLELQVRAVCPQLLCLPSQLTRRPAVHAADVRGPPRGWAERRGEAGAPA